MEKEKDPKGQSLSQETGNSAEEIKDHDHEHDHEDGQGGAGWRSHADLLLALTILSLLLLLEYGFHITLPEWAALSINLLAYLLAGRDLLRRAFRAAEEKQQEATGNHFCPVKLKSGNIGYFCRRMKNWFVFLLALIVMTGILNPCCLDDCATEQNSSDHEPRHPEDQACSPFFACGACTGFVPSARPASLPHPLVLSPEHHARERHFDPIAYPASLFQPPRRLTV